MRSAPALFLGMANRRRSNPSARTGALIGSAIGIGIGIFAAHEDVPWIGSTAGVILSALGGLVVGASVGGARSVQDFNRALFQAA